MALTSRIHAIIVGIDKYEKKPDISFNRAIKDASAMQKLLIDLGVKEENIDTFDKAESATKQAILIKVASLKEKANRGDPIIFYYSGYIGRTSVGGRLAGMICPYDVVSNNGGISDIALMQMFKELSAFCGNNISVFLDCPIKIFEFANPFSCIVMGPELGTETEAGGEFTQTMIKVLSDMHEKQKIDHMTVQSFSAHVQANMKAGVNVRCTGCNINRPLFNMVAERGHYALVTGQAHVDGRISLNAGAAHAILPGAIYGVYETNIKSLLLSARIGQLRVDTVNKDDLTATLKSTNLIVPPFFYAVEERNAFKPLPCNTDVEEVLKDHVGWEKVSKNPTAVLEKDEDDHISIRWKGLPDDEGIRGLPRTSFDIQEKLSEISREILRAARFYSHLSEPSETSLTPTKLSIRLQKVGMGKGLKVPVELADKEEADLNNLLRQTNFSHKPVLLDCPWKEEDDASSFALTIINQNGFDVWLYVYMFDVEGFTIEPYYESSTPLQHDQGLVIGTGDDATYFHYRDDKDYDFIYLKIFVASEPMELSFITQSYCSESEDRLRCFSSEAQQADETSTDPSDKPVTSPTSPWPASKRRRTSYKWASMTIRIINDYTNAPTN